MMTDIFKNILLNVSVLVLVAYLLTKFSMVREFITGGPDRLYTKLVMAVIFGLIGILSTYTGIKVQGAIANTRVIAVVAGGILGGPIVGLGAGIIAGLHRYAIDIGGFTAAACAISTITEGIIGGIFFKYIKRTGNKWTIVCAVTMMAEIVQMGIILLIARPFEEAWHLVEVISAPMILFNSLGVVVFVGIFDSVFIEQDRESANRVRLVMNIADQCLPYLRHGLYDKESLDRAAAIILEQSGESGVVITDRREILSYAGSKIKKLRTDCILPAVVSRTIETGKVQMAEDSLEGDGFYECLKQFTAVCAPLTRNGEVIGTLVLFIRKFKLTREVEFGFVGGLARLFSTQLELSEVENQKKLLRKAEFHALQSQVNPHFLFNALSTITAFCREKPERARELLIVLSTYFRNTLQTGHYMISLQNELNHVNAYLELEKARFEEKLQIELKIPDELDCTVPSFIVQPIVENAVKHGAMHSGGAGMVRISAVHVKGETRISVLDNGPGIPSEIVRQLYSDTLGSNSVGLANVHKRLISIYGEAYGLLIRTNREGTEITIRIPDNFKPMGGGET
ncbi:LytS/YhcK type 5TM receptor domain-containing protein [Oscillospiraceae bacterium PP1C4]